MRDCWDRDFLRNQACEKVEARGTIEIVDFSIGGTWDDRGKSCDTVSQDERERNDELGGRVSHLITGYIALCFHCIKLS